MFMKIIKKIYEMIKACNLSSQWWLIRFLVFNFFSCRITNFLLIRRSSNKDAKDWSEINFKIFFNWFARPRKMNTKKYILNGMISFSMINFLSRLKVFFLAFILSLFFLFCCKINFIEQFYFSENYKIIMRMSTNLRSIKLKWI